MNAAVNIENVLLLYN